MPRAQFTDEFKKTDNSDFPKVRLEKDGRSRMVLLETQPHFEYVHTVRAPKLVNGRPAYKKTERKSGEVVEEREMDFIGRPICFGDLGILEDRGLDPANCPVCAEAQKGDMAQPPQRRFAVHVFSYAIRQGGFEVASPFSGQVLMWVFTDTTFNKLLEFSKEHGNLQAKDLLLGPCTNVTFQTADLNISSKGEWLASDDRKRFVATSFRENRCGDPGSLCGRKVERRWVEDDLAKVRDRWAAVHRFEDSTNGHVQAPVPGLDQPSGPSPSLAADLEGLLASSTDTPVQAGAVQAEPAAQPQAAQQPVQDLSFQELAAEPAAPAQPAPPPVEFGDLLAGIETSTAPAAAQPAPQAAAPQPAPPAPVPPEPVKVGSSGEEPDFADLLAQLDE